eukprot:Skav226703  [mRNA]  locus=scaffold3811:26379:26939:- [translate_table: standard]
MANHPKPPPALHATAPVQRAAPSWSVLSIADRVWRTPWRAAAVERVAGRWGRGWGTLMELWWLDVAGSQQGSAWAVLKQRTVAGLEMVQGGGACTSQLSSGRDILRRLGLMVTVTCPKQDGLRSKIKNQLKLGCESLKRAIEQQKTLRCREVSRFLVNKIRDGQASSQKTRLKQGAHLSQPGALGE